MAPSQQAAPKPVIVWHRVSLIVTLILAASTLEAAAAKRTAADSCRKIALFVINSFFIIVRKRFQAAKVSKKSGLTKHQPTYFVNQLLGAKLNG
jgi:hypothetical protein